VTVPHFTLAGGLILPSEYLISHGVKVDDVLRISFDMTGSDTMERGNVIAHINNGTKYSANSSNMYPFRGGLRMRGCYSLRQTSMSLHKQLMDFKYLATVTDDKNYEYGIIVFEEEK